MYCKMTALVMTVWSATILLDGMCCFCPALKLFIWVIILTNTICIENEMKYIIKINNMFNM